MCDYDYGNVAAEYDDLLKLYEWRAPELIYNYLSKNMRHNSKLLDIGVGTGISSQGFHQLGVELHGLDNSADMLDICKAKNVFAALHLFDILKDDIPYPKSTFEYAICSGVLHFFSDLDHIFSETSSVLKQDGFFAFTFIENLTDNNPYTTETTDGVNLYYHHKNYIENLANKFNFTFLFTKIFTTIKNLKTKETLDHKLMVLRKG